MTVAVYHQPGSLPEALALLERDGPSLLVMAGGTVAMPLINEGLSLPEAVMGLRRAGLDRMERVGDELRIGATVTLTQLLDQTHIPMLSEAARNTGSWSIRNMGTVGGNLFTPPPGGDVAVALLALDARATLASTRGERSVPLAEFHTGFLTSQLADDELLVRLDVPMPGAAAAFVKFGRRHAQHAGRGHGRGPARVGRRARGRRSRGAWRRRTAPHPSPAGGATADGHRPEPRCRRRRRRGRGR